MPAQALSATLTELLVTTREAHPFWGARKLLAVLQAKHPRIAEWHAPSTVADLLARRGLVQRRRTRRPTAYFGDSDHSFRSKSISRFGPCRSPSSVDVDQG